MWKISEKNGIIIIKEGGEELLNSIAEGEVCSISIDCGIAHDTLIFKNKGRAVFSVLSDAYCFLDYDNDFVAAICELENKLKEKYEDKKYLDVKDNLVKLDNYQYRKK